MSGGRLSGGLMSGGLMSGGLMSAHRLGERLTFRAMCLKKSKLNLNARFADRSALMLLLCSGAQCTCTVASATAD